MKGTPLKICVFGNSHVAAVKHGWEDHANRWPNLDVRFVGAHKGLLLETTVKHGWLRPSSPAAKDAFARLGGGTGVRLADFDAFVVTGGLVALSLAASLYRRTHWIGLPSVASHTDLANSDKLLISRQAAVDSLVQTLSHRLGPAFIRHLRAHTDAPIMLTSQPRVSEVLLTLKDPATQAHRLAHAAGDGANLSQVFNDSAQIAVETSGGTYLPQPSETITHHIMTKKTFMSGARRLTAQNNALQPPSDIRHANADYGACVLEQIAAQLT